MAAPQLLLAGGQNAAGQSLAAERAGSALVLQLPAAGKLERARLQLAAASEARAALTGTRALSDAGQLAAGTSARQINVEWDREVALCGIRLDAASPPANGAAARIKVCTNGVWLPLAPMDTVKAGAEQAFSPVAASKLAAEMLVLQKLNDAGVTVALPGGVNVTGVALTATAQPCHVSVAVADDPPFWTWAGPLPATAVEVDGLARAVNRYLSEHPDATRVPLRLAAAATAQVKIALFDAAQVAPPEPKPGGGTGGGTGGGSGGTGTRPPRPETDYLVPAAPATQLAQWCAPRHALAQRFAALPAGGQLSSLALYLRVLADFAAVLEIRPDYAGQPGPQALPGARFELAAPQPADAAWTGLVLDQPLALDAAWWLICTATRGEALWYADAAAPPAAGPCCAASAGGPWLPAAAAAPSGWLQARLRLAAPAAQTL